MYSLFFLGVVSFAVSLLLTPLLRNLFLRLGVVDLPDDKRKVHQKPIPRVGGVAVVVSYVAGFLLLFRIKPDRGFDVLNTLDVDWLLLSAAVVFAIGLLDDVIGLRPWQKLLGETVAALLVFWGGVHVESFSGHTFVPWLSLPLTVAWLVLCTNAVNLIDGIDGLAAGVGLFASGTMLLAALAQNNTELALVTVPLVGGLLAFLRYNFNPATIFLGDSGSLFIGFLLGCYGILWSQKAATILGMTAPIMALSIPLIDTSVAVARRFLGKRPIFGADRGHIHHRLLDRGFTPRETALLLYACCAVGAIASLLVINENISSLVIVIFCLVGWIGIQQIGYVEFGIAGQMLRGGVLRRYINCQMALKTFEEELSTVTSPQECWAVISKSCGDLGFEWAEMALGGQSFRSSTKMDNGACWYVVVPISETDYIRFARRSGSAQQDSATALFAEVIQKTLSAKLRILKDALTTEPRPRAGVATAKSG